jgi:holo-[acyl-carrier protein] synthase
LDRTRLGIRVGTDLVATEEVAWSMGHFGDRYLTRLFTPREIANCRATPFVAADRFAARFAAKEATIKVLRPRVGWTDFRDIEIESGPGGAPILHLHGEAAALAARAGLFSFSVSLSHERAYACAVVAALEDPSFSYVDDGAPEEETKS